MRYKIKDLINYDLIPLTFIFAWLYQINKNLPWQSDIQYSNLDNIYIHTSGEKYISPLLERYVVDGRVTNQVSLATAVNKFYIKKWERLYNILKLEYNPIENYSMVETEDGSNTRTDNFTNTNETTDSNTNTSNEQDETLNIEQQFGFNSNDWNNVNKNENNNTLTKNETSEHELNSTQNNTGTSSNEQTRTLTRSGNIGVTTSQQMIQSEIELWKWNFFYDVVFPDIDELLTLSIYGTEV